MGSGNYQSNAWVGNGAIVRGTIPLTQGQILTLVVGQYPNNTNITNTTYWGPGGGGGSFVVDSSNNVIY